jgi:hypothetical protein
MSTILHAWYSKQMVTYTQTIYIYNNSEGKKIKASCISNSDILPFKDIHKSIYNDFIYVGPVTTYSTTICTLPRDRLQKKFYYPKPLSY